MTANIVKDDRHPNMWMIRWRENTADGIRQKKKRGFKTKKEAQQFWIEYCNINVVSEPQEEPEHLMFATVAEEWLEYERMRVKASSYTTLKSRLFAQLMPAFGDMPIRDITPLQILKWQEKLQGTYKYRDNIRTRLVSIFKYASKYHDVVNVMDKVDGLRNLEPKKEMSFWTPEQFTIFSANCQNSMYKLFFVCLYVFGCRKGELQALSWADLNLDTGDVHICHTVTNKVSGQTWTVTTPKNRSSDRHIRIPMQLCAQLKEWKSEVNGKPDEFVFGTIRPLPAQSITNIFDATIKNANLPRIRIHDLRHSCASLLISQGIDIVTVSKRLGHSSVKQTLDTYSHMMPEDDEAIINVLPQYNDM